MCYASKCCFVFSRYSSNSNEDNMYDIHKRDKKERITHVIMYFLSNSSID